MSNVDTRLETPRLTGRLVAGLFVLGLGVVFLLDNFGVFDAGRLWDWWPVLLIAVGVSHLFSGTTVGVVAGRRQVPLRRDWGLILIAVGSFFLLRNLHLVHVRWREVWPFLLVLFGASIVWRSLRRPSPADSTAVPAMGLNEFAILGGGERRIRSNAFRGGEVTAILGGFEVDLRDATLAPEGACIEVLVLLGGLELRVPESWPVVVRATPILGGSENRTAWVDAGGEAVPALTITGTVVMGGLEIKN